MFYHMDMRQSLFEGHVTEPRRTFAAYPVACPNVTRPPGSLHTPSLRTCGIPYMTKPPDWTVALQSQLAENVPFFSRRKAVAGRGSKQVGKQLLLYTSLHGPNPPCAANSPCLLLGKFQGRFSPHIRPFPGLVPTVVHPWVKCGWVRITFGGEHPPPIASSSRVEKSPQAPRHLPFCGALEPSPALSARPGASGELVVFCPSNGSIKWLWSFDHTGFIQFIQPLKYLVS